MHDKIKGYFNIIELLVGKIFKTTIKYAVAICDFSNRDLSAFDPQYNRQILHFDNA